MDHKSLRTISGKASGFNELAKDCVCFANGSGGLILIGIEDGATGPPPEQRIQDSLLGRIRKRIGELTVNVDIAAEMRTDANGGEFIALTIERAAVGVASTTDGRFFLRVGDECKPVVGDEVLRLANERPSVPWETRTALEVRRTCHDDAKCKYLCNALRSSDRVKASVREKSDDELLEHYGLSSGDQLTNLGVLLIGTTADRARLGTAPVVQAIKYDEFSVKVAKHVWDDFILSPIDLVDAVWQEIPDFRESYELPDGLLRSRVPAYEEAVVRELVVNALVHRPYTQSGDIFLNLHPDRLEVVNAGRLPLGVTPRNILHASRRRNDGLARVFHDLKMMEREGSGFDLIYDRLLTSGRPVPTVSEGVDSVQVSVPRRVVHPGVVRLMANADQQHQLTQRERIVLGMLGQTEEMSATELAAALELPGPSSLRPWISRLEDLGLIGQTGRTRATRYFVDSSLLRHSGLDGQTTLQRIHPHRLRALILEDLGRFPDSGRADINRRIGKEIAPKSITRALNDMIAKGVVVAKGERRWRTYKLAKTKGHET
nr:ATP-binding protein [Candidatus Krumholzibacteria bacterium]